MPSPLSRLSGPDRGLRPLRVLSFAAVAALVAALPGLMADPALARPADVSVRQVYPLPARGSFTVAGHGYGHGHGMSQYGAEGAARQGLGYRKILRFYYPGTTLETSSARIRVRIDEDTTRDVQVKARPGLRIKDRGNGKVYRLPDRKRIKRWRLGVHGGRTVVSFRTKHWHRYRPGGHATLRGDGEFRAPGALALVLPHGVTMRVHGNLRAASPSAGSKDRDTVNVLAVDQYVRGVVPAEMPASWHQAALRAQTVAARTYALRERADSRRDYYDLCDTSACQVYRGIAGQHPAADRAVRATKGRYLDYRGTPAFAQFSSSNGGWTSAGGYSYLPHKKDPYDGWSGNPVHNWQRKVKVGTLEQRFPKLGDLTKVVVTRREGGGQWKGRVEQLTLVGKRGSTTMSGDDFRYYCGLLSSWFAIK